MDNWLSALSLQNSVYLQFFILAVLVFVAWRVFLASARLAIRLVVIGAALVYFASVMGFSVWVLPW